MSTVRVGREDLLSKLQLLQAGLHRKASAQSDCFAFQDGVIMTYNDMVSCQIPYRPVRGLDGAVHADELLKLLQHMPEDEVAINCTDSRFVVTGTNRRGKVMMEKEIVSGAVDVEVPKDWRDLPEDFSEAVDVAAACAGKDDNKFALTCVHFHPEYLEACDNFQLTRYEIDTGVPERFLVKREAIRHVATLGVNQVAETDTWLHFKAETGLVYSCRLYTEEFPELDEHLKVDGHVCQLPGGLAEEIKGAEIFQSEAAVDAMVIVHLRGNKVKLKGMGTFGEYETIVPITYGGPESEFMISPKLLFTICKRFNECEVADDRLKVDGGKYVYVASLIKDAADRQAQAAERKVDEE